MQKILLVQHNTMECRHLRSLLQKNGYHLLVAGGPSEAAELFSQHPDLVLFDVELAKDDGTRALEALGRICQESATPCISYSSGNGNPEKSRKSAPWAAAFIRQPENADEVLYKVNSQLSLRQCQTDLKEAWEKVLEEKRELEECLRSAVAILKSLALHYPSFIENLDFAWQFLPCQNVGGDLFNFSRLDEDTIMAYILDVSGHGVTSAMITVSIFQALSPQAGKILKKRLDTPPFYKLNPPSEVVRELDRQYPYERFESFFTICYLLINIKTGRVRYSNAGHPPPVLIKTDGTLEFLKEGGTIIGLDELVPFGESEVWLAPGDRILLYSDGIIEHPNTCGELYGSKRFIQKISELREAPLKTVGEKIMQSLDIFAQGNPQQDDVTLLGIEYHGKDEKD